MAQVYTTRVPEGGRHFKLAPYVTTNVPGRQGWYGYALERYSDGMVTVVWTEHDVPRYKPEATAPLDWKPVEKIKFEDVIWIEGLPKEEG